MTDTVNADIVFQGNRRHTLHLTNESDGTGETDITKLDISTLTDGAGNTATKFTVDLIEYSVSGFNYVTLEWERTGGGANNDEIAVLSGQGVIDWYAFGGHTDPATNSTGDLQLTTDGGADGSMYDITIHLRPKS